MATRLPAPLGLLSTIGWWAAVLAAATIALVIVERLARRLLPLAWLLRMSLLFPTRAPRRWHMARRIGSVSALEEHLAEARGRGIDNDATAAAQHIVMLVTALQAHDRRTRGHAERVRVYTDMLTAELGLPEPDRDRLRWAALLHDIGKLAISEQLLNKPDKLDEEEWKSLHRHPEEGARFCAPLLPWLGPWGDTVAQHHERYDGGGYPDGLAGKDITYGARIVGVPDAYEVMTSPRAYKRPMSARAARQELADHAGTQFDPAVVRAFLNLSIRRLQWVAGPAAWLAQLPFVSVPAAKINPNAGSLGLGMTVVVALALALGIGVGGGDGDSVGAGPGDRASASAPAQPADAAAGDGAPGSGEDDVPVAGAGEDGSDAGAPVDAEIPGPAVPDTADAEEIDPAAGDIEPDAPAPPGEPDEPVVVIVTPPTLPEEPVDPEEPVVVPGPDPTEEPVVVPVPESTEPVVIIIPPDPDPDPEPDPKPEPDPDPAPDPVPDPAPEPDPEPDPEPEPEPPPPPPVPPAAADDAATVDTRDTVSVAVLGNDGGDLAAGTLTIVAEPQHGSATAAGDAIVYQAQPGWEGVVQIGYQVCGLDGTCSTATLTVTVVRDRANGATLPVPLLLGATAGIGALVRYGRRGARSRRGSRARRSR